MTEVLNFVSNNPWISFFLALIAAEVLVAPFKYAFRAYRAGCRTRNIVAHGWPTSKGMDADGVIKDSET